jgi:hypothetical protein|tara:strand:- start:200 stop:1426 length:1227 start_codon:yes stop_codon:yes gene_type:complete
MTEKNIMISRKKKANVSRGTFAKYNSFNNRTGNAFKCFNIIQALTIKNKFTKYSFEKKYQSTISKTLIEDASRFENDSLDINKNLEKEIKKVFTKTKLLDFYKAIESFEDTKVIEWLDNLSEETARHSKKYWNRKESHALIDKHIAMFWSQYKGMDYFDKQTVQKSDLRLKQWNEQKLTREGALRNMVSKLVPIFSEKGYDLRLDKLRVNFSTEIKGRTLGVCYNDACDEGNKNHKIEKNTIRQISIRDKVLKSNDEIIYDNTNTRHVLAVLVHELIHAYDNNASSHGPAFKRMACDIGLQGGGVNNANFGATVPNDEFDEMYKEILKMKLPNTEFHFDKKKETKNKKLKCEVCGSRVVISNQGEKHAQVEFFCNHRGTKHEEEVESKMVEYDSKKPKTFTDNPASKL